VCLRVGRVEIYLVSLDQIKRERCFSLSLWWRVTNLPILSSAAKQLLLAPETRGREKGQARVFQL